MARIWNDTGLASLEPAQTPLLLLEAFQPKFAAESGVLGMTPERTGDPGDPCCGLFAAQTMLGFARLSAWPIAHVLYRPEPDRFDPDAPEWHPLHGFRPQATEMAFITHGPSAFANTRFEPMLLGHWDREVFLLSLASAASHIGLLAYARKKGISMHLVHTTCPEGDAPSTCEAKLKGVGEEPKSGLPGMAIDTCLRHFGQDTLMLRLAESPN